MTDVKNRFVEVDALIGRHRSELPTPALLLDLDVARRNIDAMAAALPASVGLRPHVKTHKCVELAKLQLEAGAIGVTTATVWEAMAMAEAGVDDILIANEVVGDEKLEVVAELAAERTLTVAVDDVRNAQALGAAARSRGSTVQVLVDLDVGMGRCGVRSIAEGVAVAHVVSGIEGLRLAGVMGYEGHCTLDPDRAKRASRARVANAVVEDFVGALTAEGLAVDIVSGGGTGTFDMTGRCETYTELQAGSYVFMDATYGGVVDGFAPALSVHAGVVSRKGRTVVLDCGEKTVAEIERPLLKGFASHGWTSSEEHYQLEVPSESPLDLGATVEVIPGHCCGTVNLHDRYYVIERDRLSAAWPIVARGPGRP